LILAIDYIYKMSEKKRGVRMKIKKQLQAEYGQVPNKMYFDGDLERVRAHYEFRRDGELDEFLIDDITWHDLSMDELFKQINMRMTTSGEQYLYYLLRSPTLKHEEYERRYKLIALMEENANLRLRLQVILSKLGRRRGLKLHENFIPSNSKFGKLFLYIILSLGLLASLVGTLLGPPIAILIFLLLLMVNPLYHYHISKKVEYELQTVNYIIGMIKTAKSVKKLNPAELGDYLKDFYESVKRLKSLNSVAFSIQEGSSDTKDEFAQLFTFVFNNFLFLDLIGYELVKNKLGKYHQDIFNIHETIGAIDASIAVASYRQSLDSYSLPDIDFSEVAEVAIHITDIAHPLVKNPVLNNIDTSTPILLTGSNASGKSTFLRSITLNIIMAQSICTVLATGYKAPAFNIYSSMAIADNLLAGDSYFIAEIKSIKRIVDVLSTKRPVFCVIDEILRGTNTIERISASSELLKLIAEKNALCFAATHDIELCELLKQDYHMLHFSESITEAGEVVFDYKVKTGPATTRNAIKLLEALGFDKELVQAANARASLHGKSGKWI